MKRPQFNLEDWAFRSRMRVGWAVNLCRQEKNERIATAILAGFLTFNFGEEEERRANQGGKAADWARAEAARLLDFERTSPNGFTGNLLAGALDAAMTIVGKLPAGHPFANGPVGQPLKVAA